MDTCEICLNAPTSAVTEAAMSEHNSTHHHQCSCARSLLASLSQIASHRAVTDTRDSLMRHVEADGCFTIATTCAMSLCIVHIYVVSSRKPHECSGLRLTVELCPGKSKFCGNYRGDETIRPCNLVRETWVSVQRTRDSFEPARPQRLMSVCFPKSVFFCPTSHVSVVLADSKQKRTLKKHVFLTLNEGLIMTDDTYFQCLAP